MESTGEKSGTDQQENVESAKQLLSMVIGEKYRLYLGNESNMMAILFDTGFACDETMHNSVKNVINGYNTEKMFHINSPVQIKPHLPTHQIFYVRLTFSFLPNPGM